MAGQLQARGRLTLDAGAVRVLREAGRSLLPVGVRGVHGNFSRGDMVSCRDPEGREVVTRMDAASLTRLAAGGGLAVRLAPGN